MDPQLFHGHWWIPGDDEASRQPGTLTIEPDGETYLELIGGFDLSVRTPMADGGVAVGFDEKPLPVVFGETEGKRISLLDCFSLSSRGGWFGLGRPQYHRLHVQRALVGAHVESSAANVFRACYLRFENLTMWAALPVVGRTSDWEKGVMTGTLTRGEHVDAVVEGWTYSLRTSTTGFSIEQTREKNVVAGDATTILKLSPPEAASASDFDGPVLEIMDLLTLASGTACGLISAVFEHVDVDRIERANQSPIERAVEVQSFGRRVHTAEPSAGATKLSEFRFTCRDLEFEKILSAWIPIRRKASDASNVFFGMKYSKPGFAETRMLLSAVAAEALHAALYDAISALDARVFKERREKILAALDTDEERVWVKQRLRNDPTLRERLHALAGVPDADAVTQVIPDLQSWARAIVKARNGLAHSAGRGLGPELFDLEWITSALVTLVFMAEIGLSSSVQLRAADGPLRGY